MSRRSKKRVRLGFEALRNELSGSKAEKIKDILEREADRPMTATLAKSMQYARKQK